MKNWIAAMMACTALAVMHTRADTGDAMCRRRADEAWNLLATRLLHPRTGILTDALAPDDGTAGLRCERYLPTPEEIAKQFPNPNGWGTTMEDGVLHTFPLAGTRPRGKTEAEDKVLEEELLSDPKELAEHNMLVDLGRNDLGKLSKFGTVTVEKYMSIERYSHVMHIGSTVRGELREDKDAVDAIAAVLPAGTLSGAPKLRACEIINELEQNRRGVYGGAIGYIDFTGNMDTCIAIRLAYKKNGRVFVRSGAGIVADSVPETEYQECINKAAAVVNAVRESEGGIDG